MDRDALIYLAGALRGLDPVARLAVIQIANDRSREIVNSGLTMEIADIFARDLEASYAIPVTA